MTATAIALTEDEAYKVLLIVSYAREYAVAEWERGEPTDNRPEALLLDSIAAIQTSLNNQLNALVSGRR